MKNTHKSYGLLTIFLHWFVAIIVIGLFILGYWMVDLGYYHTWYKTGPDLHKSIGLMLFVLMAFRLFWRSKQIVPEPIESHSTFERKSGNIAHKLLYILIFIIMASGYLISSADGRGIAFFDLFTVPGVGELIANQEDIAGLVHEYLAYSLMVLVLLHAGAALKHHFIDKDKTLSRMLGKK